MGRRNDAYFKFRKTENGKDIWDTVYHVYNPDLNRTVDEPGKPIFFFENEKGFYTEEYDKNGKLINTLEIKYPIKVGDTWQSDSPSFKAHNQNKVLAVNQRIKTNIGTFDNAVKIWTYNEDLGGSVHKYFVPNIGLVSQISTGDANMLSTRSRNC